ncbi:MAG: dihydropteroate synthase [Anaerolineae bacterium]
MEIIGEKINGTRQRVAKAIAERDADFIQELARQQAEAGSTWLDVNAGTHPNQEADDLIWLIENVQAAVETPLCLDSANPQALARAIKAVAKTPLINSISAEPERLEGILPWWPGTAAELLPWRWMGRRFPEHGRPTAHYSEDYGGHPRRRHPDERVYIDPLTMTISTNLQSGVIACESIRAIHQEYPQVHFTVGLSNISFGLPARSHINRAFLTLAMAAGLDSAILDPLDRDLRATILATELVLGRDRHCLNYTRAYRAGVFDKPGSK